MTMPRKLQLMLMMLLGSALTIILQNVCNSSIVGILYVNKIIHNGSTVNKLHAKSGTTPKTETIWTPQINIDSSRTKPEILRWNKGLWEEWDNVCSGSNFDSATLRTPAGLMTIYIHDIKVDKWVSGSIKKYGSWESDVVNLIYHFLSKDPTMHLLDIGSHVGQFSLMAAKMGRQAIAVDPLFENVQRLCKSIEQNHFFSKIKVFYTALSNTRTQVSFNKELGNIGGTQIIKRTFSQSQSNQTVGYNNQGNQISLLNRNQIKVVPMPSNFDKNIIETVLLDDILPFVPFKKAFIKMDVESHEHNVLLGGAKFFKSVDVQIVFMEWFQHANKPHSANQIITFMLRHGYSPRTISVQNSPLDTKLYAKWPQNVLWVKRGVL